MFLEDCSQHYAWHTSPQKIVVFLKKRNRRLHCKYKWTIKQYPILSCCFAEKCFKALTTLFYLLSTWRNKIKTHFNRLRKKKRARRTGRKNLKGNKEHLMTVQTNPKHTIRGKCLTIWWWDNTWLAQGLGIHSHLCSEGLSLPRFSAFPQSERLNTSKFHFNLNTIGKQPFQGKHHYQFLLFIIWVDHKEHNKNIILSFLSGQR